MDSRYKVVAGLCPSCHKQWMNICVRKGENILIKCEVCGAKGTTIKWIKEAMNERRR